MCMTYFFAFELSHVDDLKVPGEGNRAQDFITEFDKKFKFGDVNHGPGELR